MKKEFKPLAAVITDLHFGSKNYNKQTFESQMAFFEKQFFPYLLKNKIETVFHLGDFFHNRNHADWMILQQIKVRFFQFLQKHDIKFHTLIGNHDSYYKNTIEINSLIENFKEFSNVIIYDKPKVINFWKYTIWMVPWITNEREFTFIDNADIVMGHFDISGSKMLKDFVSNEGFNRSQFERYKLTLSGHYHIRSRNGNIHYIGSPYQLSWNDFDEPKGFCLLGEDFQIKYIENTVNPKYVKVLVRTLDDELGYTVQGLNSGKSESISEKEMLKITKNNYVRVLTESNISQTNVDNIYSSLNLVSCDGHKVEIINTTELIDDFDFTEIEKTVDIDTDGIKLITSYISGIEFDDSIDKQLLQTIAIDLYKLTSMVEFTE